MNVSSNQPPTVSITNMPSGTITVNYASFSWSGYDSDGTIQGYYYDLDDSTPDTWTTGTSHTFTNLTNGSHTFYVQSVDNDGAVSSIASSSFTVNVLSSVVLNATQDAYISESNPDAVLNHSWIAVGRLSSDTELYGLIQFDLSSIPSGSSIISATLELHHDDDIEGTIELVIREIGVNWSENSVTWNNSPGSYTFPFSIESIHQNPNSYWIDVKDHVEDWVSGERPNYGFFFDFNPVDPGNAVYFGSSENSNTSIRPHLIIDYQ